MFHVKHCSHFTGNFKNYHEPVSRFGFTQSEQLNSSFRIPNSEFKKLLPQQELFLT